MANGDVQKVNPKQVASAFPDSHPTVDIGVSSNIVGDKTTVAVPTDRERFLNERLLNLTEALGRTSLKKSQFYDLIAAGAVPQPVKIGRSSRWPESEIQQYIASLKLARNSL